ncbi:hypothetical protein RclHR1_03450001 [Rhizophagus clarus]|uniref:F-box domain-containing protein n=1 Tax=Rhizophagus clarus TaxID=94130 RepID=A0A2Z6S4L0_9GLOM|nr:hypothetical protein RclHR1_03450001 [Rhizophagus clarus]GES74355.1 hypothetical protein GLOIN_2v1644672 [Rhizophagus clarus]
MIKINVDCLSFIFNELQTNKTYLHSCLLVNKKWCHLIVPILWESHPWNINNKKSKEKLFNIILSCLSFTSRQLLFDNNIKLPSTILSKTPSFNYVSYCKFLKSKIIKEIIEMVSGKVFVTGKYGKYEYLEQELYKLYISQCKNIKGFSWQTSQPLLSFPGASICFSQLYSLSINEIDKVDTDSLYKMSRICKDLNILIIHGYSQEKIPGLISLIDAQRKLKSVSFEFRIKQGPTCKELSEALARKGNTINKLNLRSVKIIPPSFLTSLTNLKTISIYNDYDSDVSTREEFQNYLAISEFPELQILCINGLSCFKESATLVEKTRGNISHVNIYTSDSVAENTGMLIKAIANNCPNIEQLSTYLIPEDFDHVRSLLLNCKNIIYLGLNSLEYFTDMDENYDVGDELLNILTKFSPKSLTKMVIGAGWKYSVDAFERYFESCRERKLYYFGISYNIDNINYITDEHEIIIKKYIDEKVIIEFVY